MKKQTEQVPASALPAPQQGQVQTLLLDALQMEQGLQLRSRIDQEHVDRLVEAYLAQEEDNSPIGPPPIRVLWDGKQHWVWDGNHRILARVRAGFDEIAAYVEKGTYRDAILRAAGANHDHGLPRSSRDKRAAVRALLVDKTWGKRSDRWIAETAKVSRPLVAEVRAEMQAEQDRQWAAQQVPDESHQVAVLPPDDNAGGNGRVGRDGKTYPNGNGQTADGDEDDRPKVLALSERTALFGRIQDVYRRHLQDKTKLNRQEVELVQAILDGRKTLDGQTKDQALQILELHGEPAFATTPPAETTKPGIVYGEAETEAGRKLRERLVSWLQTQLRNIDNLDWQVISYQLGEFAVECETWEYYP
jgi:hypothetical protein